MPEQDAAIKDYEFASIAFERLELWRVWANIAANMVDFDL
jgi:hypothetical protein